MIATVLRDFVYVKQNKRYYEGDVISLSQNEFDRINLNKRPILLEGKHDLGTKGRCYPCEQAKKKQELKTSKPKK